MRLDERVAGYVRRIREAFPEVSARQIVPIIGHGQNNDVLLVDDTLIFRFPRYAEGIPCLERSVRLLRAIHRLAVLPVPNPVYIVFDDPRPTRAFVGYPSLPGEPLTFAAFEQLSSEDTRQELVDQLATFLRQLHAIPPGDVLPEEAGQFDPLAHWSDVFERIQRHLFPHMRQEVRDDVSRHFRSFLADPRNRSIRASLVHGDFGTSNLLFDPQTNRLTGVVDFDGAHVGDPALDLAAASGYGLARLAHLYPEAAGFAHRIAFYVGTFALQEALFGRECGDTEAFERGMKPYV